MTTMTPKLRARLVRTYYNDVPAKFTKHKQDFKVIGKRLFVYVPDNSGQIDPAKFLNDLAKKHGRYTMLHTLLKKPTHFKATKLVLASPEQVAEYQAAERAYEAALMKVSLTRLRIHLGYYTRSSEDLKKHIERVGKKREVLADEYQAVLDHLESMAKVTK